VLSNALRNEFEEQHNERKRQQLERVQKERERKMGEHFIVENSKLEVRQRQREAENKKA